MDAGQFSRPISTNPQTAAAHNLRHVFVSRQPIYDRQLAVFAYTVLFHTNKINQDSPMQGYMTTPQMLANTFMDIGLETIVGQKRALFPLTRSFILLDYTSVFPANRVILEVAPNTPVDMDLCEAVRNLAEQGYSVALPDVFAHGHLRPLLEVADMIKIDVHAYARAQLPTMVAHLRPYGVKLFAEHVETLEDFAFCRTLGFDYVQGYFFCQPDVVKGKRTPTNRLAITRLLAKLLDPKTEFHELEALVRCDVSLSYKLLRLINSSFFGLPRTIRSIRQALLLLGIRRLTTWISLMLLSGVDDKPHELTVTAMVRAKMCELLAQAMAQDGEDTFFLVGLFSVLDAFTDCPMSEVLKALPLTDDVNRALLSHQGVLGATLHSVLAYERGDWDAINCLGLDRGVITDAYLQAIAWSTQYRMAL
jgi:EAL and modified HD-GYP domain-containing signal transduction protein